MKRLIVLLLLIFPVVALAGYPETSFKSMYQAKGLKVSWMPGANTFRVTLTKPTMKEIKMFVPPGTISVNLTGFVAQGNNLKFKFIARYGSPPVSNTIPAVSLNNDGFKLSVLNQDCFGENSSGYLRIAIDGGLSVTEGKWLYVVITQADGAISSISGVITVDKTKYAAWYNSAAWGKDGDPVVSGTPATPGPTPATTPIANPTPKPTPVQTPTATCNELLCTLSGGRCVNDVCVKSTPMPTPVPIIDTYRGESSGMPITVEIANASTGTVSIRVGDKTVSNLAYKEWEHGGIKTIYVDGVGYLEITGTTLKINIFSGITLEKR